MKKIPKDYGGAALEYIIVTVFAAVVSAAAMSVIADVMDQQLDHLAEKTGVARDETPWFEP